MDENNENQDVVAEGQPPSPKAKDQDMSKWSWGGFMFEPILIIGTKQYMYALLFLLYLLPLINILAVIGIKIYFGLKGREFAFESGAFENRDQWKGFMNTLDHAGYVLFIITAVFIAIGLFAGGAAIMAMFGGGGAEFIDETINF